MSQFLNNLEPIVRTGPAVECAECRGPILFNHVYFIDESDTMGTHPFCWLCGVAIELHLGKIREEDLPYITQFGPLPNHHGNDNGG